MGKKDLSRAWLVVAIVAALVFVGCAPATAPSQGSGGASPSLAPQRVARLTYSSIFEPRSLDPARDNVSFTIRAVKQIYDGLVAFDDKGNIHSYIATSWEKSADGLTWTFKLRTDVKFHDGTPLNAAAVKFSFDRIADQKTASPDGSKWRSVISSVEAPDASTVRLVLKSVYAPLLAVLAGAGFLIVSPTAVQKYGEDFARNPVGSGAYQFVEWRKNDRIVLKRNPDYHWAPALVQNTGAAYADELVIRLIPEMTNLVSSMETGESQILDWVNASDADYLASKGFIKVTGAVPGQQWVYYMNVKKQPTDDINVRRAIGYALNPAAFYEAPIWKGSGGTNKGALEPSNPFYSKRVADQFGFSYDPDKAKQILDAAGWKVGSDGIREKDGKKLVLVDVTDSQTPFYIGSSQIAQQQLRAVGIQTDIRALTQATFSQAQAKGEHNIAFRTVTGFDPNDIFTRALSCGTVGVSGSNMNLHCNPKIDDLLAQGVKELDQQKRFAIYDQVQEYILKEALAIPLLLRTTIYVLDPKVAGFRTDPNYDWFAHDTWMRP